MKRKYIRLKSSAARWSPRCGLCAIVLLVLAILIIHLNKIDFNFFLFLCFLSVFFAFLALMTSVKGFIDLWRRGDEGGIRSFYGFIFACIALTLPIGAIFFWFFQPPLYDVSTDIIKPPHFLSGQRPENALTLVQDFSQQPQLQGKMWNELAGRRYDSSADSVLTAALLAIKANDWDIVGQEGWHEENGKPILDDEESFLIATSAKTPILGLTSDIIIRLVDKGDATFVDMRSASRILKRDYGMNAGFIIKFMNQLDDEVLRPASPSE